eukprot:1016554-Amphidinium_carterae.1
MQGVSPKNPTSLLQRRSPKHRAVSYVCRPGEISVMNLRGLLKLPRGRLDDGLELSHRGPTKMQQ